MTQCSAEQGRGRDAGYTGAEKGVKFSDVLRCTMVNCEYWPKEERKNRQRSAAG
jgi:hypothetical protein